MVFSFFARKTQTLQNIDATEVALPQSPPLIDTSLPATSNDVQQLRTPSPSIDSASIAGPTSAASLVPSTANNSSYSSTRQTSEPIVLPTPIQTEPTQPAILPTPGSLATLIKSVPAKTLHSYVLEELPSASTTTLESLCAFFNTLTPPPKLHCARCHKDYTEVENDDRSCLVPHDDDSAEVERVGRSGEARRTKEGTEYETLWGCCGKTTEGDGSAGPPEGWCYEGKHTTDVKRARFRADSTPQDDKLTSCLRLNCHGIRERMPRVAASTRKRGRKTYKEASTDDDGSEGEADSGMEEITGKGKGRMGPMNKSKTPARKRKGKEREIEEEKMDVDQEQNGDSVTIAGSSGTKTTSVTVATPMSAPPKRRGRPPKRKVEEQSNEDGASSVGPVTPASKRRGRPPKSKPLIENSDAEAATTGKPSPSPTRGGSHTPRTRSISRGRQPGNVSRLAAEFSGRSASTKRTPAQRSRLAVTMSAEYAADVEMEDDQPKKKRKLGS